jgi:hypothetical protein
LDLGNIRASNTKEKSSFSLKKLCSICANTKFSYLREHLLSEMSNSTEEVLSDEDFEEDIKQPSYILNNLEIASIDCFDDDSCMTAARLAAANIISQQICYHVSCVLHGFKHRQVPAAPCILVYGGGYIGKRVIESLVDHKCGSMLYVYSRSDLRAKFWRSTGLRSSPSLSRLLKNLKADVVILLSGMSSFQSLTKHLMP